MEEIRMEKFNQAITNTMDKIYADKIRTDHEYKKLEFKKNTLITELRRSLSAEDFNRLEQIMDCYEGQEYIIAMALSKITILDVDRLT